jgi:peptidyl-prolyl cis-trans isomerase A (cyclophilin A)
MRLRPRGVVVALLCLAVAAWACDQEEKPVKRAEPVEEAAVQVEGQAEAEPTKPVAGNMVRMTTSMGTIDLELFPEEAPITVENFLTYVNEDFYNGTIFHRVIPGFVIQGGGFTPEMERKSTHDPIKNEAANGLKNLRGTLSMARTNVIDSATSQFFVNLKDNASLDHVPGNPDRFGYAVFAKVAKGMDVVDAIAKVATGRKGVYSDIPLTPVLIEKAAVLPPQEK